MEEGLRVFLFVCFFETKQINGFYLLATHRLTRAVRRVFISRLEISFRYNFPPVKVSVQLKFKYVAVSAAGISAAYEKSDAAFAIECHGGAHSRRRR